MPVTKVKDLRVGFVRQLSKSISTYVKRFVLLNEKYYMSLCESYLA